MTEKLSLGDALRALDPANDDHWTQAGKPGMAALEDLTGDTSITREDVDRFAPDFDRARATEVAGLETSAKPAAGEVTQTDDPGSIPVPTPGRIVNVHAAPETTFDGERVAAAVVAKVNDDGTINARVFSPNGGADAFITGVDHAAHVEAREGADRNVASWSWPVRV